MATLQSGKCFTVPTFFGMCCRSEWQERMYIYKWHEVDQTKHEIFCVHIVCNEIQVKVNLEITTFFFICVFHTVPIFSDLGLYTHTHTHTLYIKYNNICKILFNFYLFLILFSLGHTKLKIKTRTQNCKCIQKYSHILSAFFQPPESGIYFLYHLVHKYVPVL